jgi:hypothetical protein
MAPVTDISAAAFSDANEMDEGYMAYIELAISAGFLNPEGMGGNAFSPNSVTTRGQAATLQINMMRHLNRME